MEKTSSNKKKTSKLRSEESTKAHLGKKLRYKKANNKLTDKEVAKAKKLKKQSFNTARNMAAKAASVTHMAGNAGGSGAKEEYESMNTTVSEEVISETGYILGSSGNLIRSKLNNSKYSSRQHGRKAANTAKETEKNRMRKEMQRKALERQRKNAENTGKVGRKLTDKAEDFVGKIGEFIVEFVKDNPVASIIILLVLIVILVLLGIFSSCGVAFTGAQDITIATTYTAKDSTIREVDRSYTSLEQEVQTAIDNIPNDYPGYDEYNYYLDEIGHNPYQLAAILTVLYEDYTKEEVQQKLSEIKDLQYELTTQRVVETRYRQEERTGSRWVSDSSSPSGGYYESYTYTVTVSYQYYILNVTLKNRTLNEVVNQLGFTEDQLQRYQILLATYGNKKYLFEYDIYSVKEPGEYEDYDVPGEYLTDEEFANMMREAEKYLGMVYVWGGDSPSTGFDCSGFVSWVINHSGNGWNVGRQTANGLKNSTARVSASDVKPGDLIFFQGTYDTSGASHVGIVVDPVNKIMIHCGNPISYASYDTNYWRNHFYCYGRIR
ncbi:MAG: C40 family peptidase [Pseudobutyrivibrio sp.]|nr:C40 family peptidase [Pseudobutyrivibrio sp.]